MDPMGYDTYIIFILSAISRQPNRDPTARSSPRTSAFHHIHSPRRGRTVGCSPSKNFPRNGGIFHQTIGNWWFNGEYPLVNIQKTMENHHFIAGKTHYNWPFSIDILT